MRSYRAERGQQRAERSFEQGVIDENASTIAIRALIGEVDEQTLTDALAGHLHETEVGDVEDLRTGLVAGQCGSECVDDLATIVLDLHVDEVDHDDATDVAKAELLGDLLGGLEVVAEDRLFEVEVPTFLPVCR
jgi:hypothetical protein